VSTEGRDSAPRVVNLDEDTLTLGKNQKHTIDVVIDRVKVGPAVKQRLAESFETALRLADGRAVMLNMDGGQEQLLSNRFACPICNHSLRELEPRLFSFNNPLGACPECDGLGMVEFFDPKRVVLFPNLSLASGAIKGWDRRNQLYFQMLASLAAFYSFDVDTPFESLPDAIRGIVLHGSGSERDALHLHRRQRQDVVREHPFEGVIPNLERRWKETDSAHVREELAKYRNTRVCPACEGTRLRLDARHVRVGPRGADRPIWEVSHWTLRHALQWFDTLVLPAQPGPGRRADRARDRQPAALPEQRRPRLPVARPRGRDAVGRRVAAHPAGQPDRLGSDRRDVCARRALDRPAPARQRPPARHARTCATSAIRCWWSSTTRTRSARPTT
jgi:excinuclease ABC subunit A